VIVVVAVVVAEDVVVVGPVVQQRHYRPDITQHSHTNGYARRDINIHTIQSAQSLIARKQILYFQ